MKKSKKLNKTLQLFKKGNFHLHKWNSKVSELESENSNQNELTYAKQVLNQDSNETKILDLGWNKLASVNDPTGLISPAHLIGKKLYREICEPRILWDE